MGTGVHPSGDVAVPRRLAGLDGLRALAVGMVVLHNYRHKVDGRLTSFRGGYIGVTLFFVLSGFLITSLLLVEHDSAGRCASARSTCAAPSGCCRRCC